MSLAKPQVAHVAAAWRCGAWGSASLCPAIRRLVPLVKHGALATQNFARLRDEWPGRAVVESHTRGRHRLDQLQPGIAVAQPPTSLEFVQRLDRVPTWAQKRHQRRRRLAVEPSMLNASGDLVLRRLRLVNADVRVLLSVRCSGANHARVAWHAEGRRRGSSGNRLNTGAPLQSPLPVRQIAMVGPRSQPMPARAPPCPKHLYCCVAPLLTNVPADSAMC